MSRTVGVVGPQKVDDFAENICSALDDMGIVNVKLGPAVPVTKGRFRAHAYDLGRQASTRFEQSLQSRIISRAAEAGCDVILNVDGRLSAASVRRLRDQGAKVALWFPDAVTNLGRLSMLWAPYDRLYLKDPLLVERLTTMYDFPAVYLPEACNPSWHRPTGDAGTKRTVAVVGNLYPTRLKLLDMLLDEGIPLDLYGGVPPRGVAGFRSADINVHPFVGRVDKARVFHEARVVLNNLHPGEMSSVNCRLFEAAASGGVVVCEERESLGELFERGSEVLGFANFKQLVGHIRSALDEPEAYLPLREAASARAHRDHTYESRLSRVLEDLA